LFNVFEADRIGCQIITVPHSVLSSLPLVGKNLDEYSLDTVKGFYKDSQASGFKINVPERRAAS
jgi:transaldolase